MSGYPCRGWRDSSKESSVITDVIYCEVFPFNSKGKLDLGFSCFRGMYYQNPHFFGAGCSMKFSALFILFEGKYLLLNGLVFPSKLLSESLEAFFRVGLFAWTFEGMLSL
jgi:hypothetical protein